MKNIITIAIMAFAAMLTGQSSGKVQQDTVVYLTDAQEAFMIDKETKYLFKIGPLGFERKLSESFSINLIFQPTYSASSGLRLESGAELRYYYKMKRLISEGKQANNLSSEYVSTGIDYDGLFPGSSYPSRNINYKISWGSQKRFLNYGYFDYSLSMRYAHGLYDLSKFGLERFESKAIVLSTRTAVGFAFGKRYKIDDVVSCPIFKCHLDRKSILKLNLNKVFSIAYGSNSIIDEKSRLVATINPNMAYEHKLGASSFSIDHDLDLLVGFSSRVSNLNAAAGLSNYSIGYTATLKHYFKMKSNIRKGKSGNNLSGYYWFAGASFQYGNSKLPLYSQSSDAEVGKHRYTEIPFGLGYQKTMLDDYYFDFRIGIQTKIGESIVPPVDEHNNNVIVDFKVGRLF